MRPLPVPAHTASLIGTLKCPGCAVAKRHACEGYPACRCWQCHGAEIRAEAMRRLTPRPGDAAMVRAALAAMVALDTQRWHRLDIIRRMPSRTVYCPMCGIPVAASPWGRPRQTCGARCRKRLERHRRKLAQQVQASG
jgi:hypothetical protein